MGEDKAKSRTHGEEPKGGPEYHGWGPFESQKGQILKMFRKRYLEHDPATCDGSGLPEITAESNLVRRMCLCLIHLHSKTPAEALSEEQTSVQSIIDQPVFYDLILTDSLARQQESAEEVYRKEYREPLVRTSCRLNNYHVPEGELPEWWSEFYFYLTIAPDDRPARVEQFCGRSRLKKFLCQVLARYLLGGPRKEKRYREVIRKMATSEAGDQTYGGYSVPEDMTLLMEQVFGQALTTAFRELSPEERLRISLHNRLQNQVIAKRFRESDSQTSRKYHRAKDRLCEAFAEHLKEAFQTPQLQEKLSIFDPEKLCGMFVHELKQQLREKQLPPDQGTLHGMSIRDPDSMEHNEQNTTEEENLS
ncbi:MAG: hypothetical protein Q4C47_04520 [Planctomycetia bacterium]|nr:hypothetical protein [Planctomycetia bacterium]